ncbi:response regulator transcription factor [Candidatus Parcubacteria bacterium]|nr:response regulator transcription factor [Candidatus Parcubacteria bacterium]
MRILIVEDEEKLAKSLKKGLEKEGYAADYITDGEVAQRRIEICHKDYDLVILDWMLPKKDGVEICKAVRAEHITIPILMLTARVDTNDKVTALDIGADDYLVKPFSLEELLARVRALLRRPAQALPTELKIQDLTLNTGTRKVTRNSKEIKLTVKEFALLEYLMRHPNQVINRNQILDHLWGFDFDSFSNVVDVHIKNLRKKINNSRRKILETIRGIGYRIKDTSVV